MKSPLAAYRAAADRYLDEHAGQPSSRVPLTASQHILHLLLTIFTAGLWLPVWIIRAMRGNPNPEWNAIKLAELDAKRDHQERP